MGMHAVYTCETNKLAFTKFQKVRKILKFIEQFIEKQKEG